MQRELQHTFMCAHTLTVLNDRAPKPKRASNLTAENQSGTLQQEDERSNKGGNMEGFLSVNIVNEGDAATLEGQSSPRVTSATAVKQAVR